MKCNFKLLSLYLDGGLGQRKREKLERHLQLCESCAEKLEELKELEAVVAREKLPQISEAYWETFSARVRNKLLLRERELGSDSFWKKLQGTFRISPFRLKLAGAVATIIIAAWIGRLYIDYSPTSLEKQLPSRNLNLPQKMAAPAETTRLPAVSSQTKKDQAEGKESVKSEPKQSASPPEVSPAGLMEGKSSSVNKKSAEVAAPVELPTEKVNANKPVTEKGETANLRRITSKDIETLPVKSVGELLSHQIELAAAPSSLSTDSAGNLHSRGGRAGEILQPSTEKKAKADLQKDTSESTNVFPAKTMDEMLKDQVEYVAKNSKLHAQTTSKSPILADSSGVAGAKKPLMADTTPVAGDTISQISAMRREIDKLEEFILIGAKNFLKDTDIPYLALAESYLELCALTKDREDKDIAQKRIQEILQKPLYAETRISLNKILGHLRALEKSLE